MKTIYTTKKIPKDLKQLEKILLENRDIKDKKEFFNPTYPEKITLESLDIDPKEMKAVIKRIEKAKEDGETIVVFGDYDADGICATAILWQALFDIDCKVVPFIPHRKKHGYGVSIGAIDEIISVHKPGLIITVDNGIVAHEPVKYLREKKIDVIITDHHSPEFKDELIDLPDANHIIHSTKLCGATVAWMIAKEINKKTAMESLDLCALATIADQVPLHGANRSFAKYGLEALRSTRRLGITTLLGKTRLKQLDINAGSVGYSIAPLINAMGRLDHGLEALRLLCTKNRKQADTLAELLNQTNIKRRMMTKELIAHAKDQADAIEDEHMIIVHSDNYHEGILGLIAGGLTERFHKPTVAISISSDSAKASVRSVDGVNIVELLREIKDDLLAVGGHPMAAGFSFLPEKLETIKKRLFKLAKEKISADNLIKANRVEIKLPANLITDELVEITDKFKPFGKKNPQPIFEIEKLSVLEIATMGKDQNHLRLSLGADTDKSSDMENNSGGGSSFKAIGWRMSSVQEYIDVGDTVSVIGNFEFNFWRDSRTLQMFIKSVGKEE